MMQDCNCDNDQLFAQYTSDITVSIVCSSPYAWPLMEHLLKVMMFWVRVPVLSLKMYSTCPSSSFSVVVRASAAVLLRLQNILRSQLMK